MITYSCILLFKVLAKNGIIWEGVAAAWMLGAVADVFIFIMIALAFAKC